jgi:hypothetical protein
MVSTPKYKKGMYLVMGDSMMHITEIDPDGHLLGEVLYERHDTLVYDYHDLWHKDDIEREESYFNIVEATQKQITVFNAFKDQHTLKEREQLNKNSQFQGSAKDLIERLSKMDTNKPVWVKVEDYSANVTHVIEYDRGIGIGDQYT